MRVRLGSCLLLAGLALAGCDRGADTGATANPVLPGRPGEGNPPVTTVPLRTESTTVSPGISEDAKSQTLPGITGRGQASPDVPLVPGVGTAGGLGGAPTTPGDSESLPPPRAIPGQPAPVPAPANR